MSRIFSKLLFFTGFSFIMITSLDVKLENVIYGKDSNHGTAYACKDLLTVGRSYCFDETSSKYMTIGLFKKLDDYKPFLNLQDRGVGISLIVLEKQVNIYKESFCKVKIKQNGYEGWIKESLINYD